MLVDRLTGNAELARRFPNNVLRAEVYPLGDVAPDQPASLPGTCHDNSNGNDAEVYCQPYRMGSMRVAGLCTVPSWGYMVDQNATTIWERWDAYVAGRGRWGGHQHPIMNSLNHFAFGSVGEWVWRELAGINPDADDPGYKRFVIRPRPCGDLTWLKASYDSIRGTITSEWKVVDRAGFHLDVQIMVRHGDRLMASTDRRERAGRSTRAVRKSRLRAACSALPPRRPHDARAARRFRRDPRTRTGR